MTRDIVFIHSTGLGPFMWAPYQAALARAMPEARVHLPANLGYPPGQSVERPQRVTLRDELDAMGPLLRTLGDDVHLVAHSYGALVALELARSGQVPVRSVYLYEPVMFASLRARLHDLPVDAAHAVRSMYADPGFYDDETHGGGDDWLRGFVDYWNGAGAWDASSPKLQSAMRRVGWKMHREVNAVATQARPFEDYALHVPVTVAWGGRTTAPSREMSRLLAAAMPQARTEVHEDLGHMGVLQGAESVAAAVVRHLEAA